MLNLSKLGRELGYEAGLHANCNLKLDGEKYLEQRLNALNETEYADNPIFIASFNLAFERGISAHKINKLFA